MRRKVSGLATQKPLGRLPAELEEFLSSETYSLLIRGTSGSGKTILAVTILGRFRASENMLYLATRTSPRQLEKGYPWIGRAGGLSTGPSPAPASEEGWESLVDARLDEPGIVFERITNVLMDKHAPTVVVDSWEALSESMDEDALRTNLRVLQTWRERAGARLIFVGEDAVNTAIDPVVDGVVTLSEQMFSGRRLREIFLTKLHGVKISRPSYYFSLENGLFHSFERYRPADFAFAGQSPGREPRREGGADRHHLSTGFRPLDEVLEGGYPPKSVSWIEVDPRVDSRLVVAFLSGTIRGWAASGKSVVLQKCAIDSSSMTRLGESLRASASDRIKAWGSASGKEGEVDSLVELRSKVAEAKGPVLSIVDLDRLADSGESVGETALESLTDYLEGRAEFSILVSRSKPAYDPVSGLVAAHIKILDLNGTVFVMSEKPWSELYGLVLERRSGKAGMQLERVV